MKSFQLRKFLLQIGPIWKLNALWKSWRLRNQYQRIIKHYCGIQAISIYSPLRKYLPPRPRLFFIGTEEGQDCSGLIQGLKRVADVSVFTTRDGKYGQLSGLGRNGIDERMENGRQLVEQVIDTQTGKPRFDLVVGQMWAYRMDVHALDILRNHNIPIVNISMDDRQAFWGFRLLDGSWGGTAGLIGHINLATTTAPEAIDWYQAEGCQAIFLPEASDPYFFHPFPEIDKKFDIVFVGLRYGIRNQIINALIRSGLKVAVYGRGWPNGYIASENVPALFARARIVLGIGTIDYSNNLFSLKMRDFDGPMSGSMYLTHANPDLFDLFRVGEEIVVYTRITECVEKASYYCRNSEERESIAQCGRIRAESDHTWEKRFQTIFGALRKNK